jgi:hypothetical protein
LVHAREDHDTFGRASIVPARDQYCEADSNRRRFLAETRHALCSIRPLLGTAELRARFEPTVLCASGKTVEVADPLSWFMIRAGWKVVAADGSEVGEVDEVAGDDTEDIFDGLAIATSAFGKPRYVPAEQVAGISQGVVRLSLTREQVVQLGEYLEPATSAEIEPDSKGGLGEALAADVREVEAKVLAPTQRHEHPMNIWRRIAFFFRRLAG